MPPGYAPRIGTPFGAGIGRLGDLCGALTGAIAAYGIVRGRFNPDDVDGKERAYAAARRIYEGFRERFGSCECREITGVDFDDAASAERYKAEDMHDRVCKPTVRGAVELLVGMLGD
ncbi:MAG: C_GCAxxG_C_C family protein [Candidatus Coatesbacteria bacterium]|nr:MAG: C_GCAxxG_C_C family protein [Candidatus Coatesbacteria bacterium]